VKCCGFVHGVTDEVSGSGRLETKTRATAEMQSSRETESNSAGETPAYRQAGRRHQRLVRGACGCGELRSVRGLGEVISFAQAVVNPAGDFEACGPLTARRPRE